jgi:hypothetical protein
VINDPLSVFVKDFAEDEDVVFEWTDDSGPRSIACKGIFDNGFVDANIGETALDTTAPRLTCLHSDVKDVPREATVTLREKEYSVLQVQPDGTGLAIVTLAIE